jgi:hypothetical protein
MSAAGIARDAATAVGFGDRPPPKRMRLTSFKLVRRGALVGFCTIRLPNGLLISDCTIWQSAAGQTWASLPTKPMLDRAGVHVKVDGKKQYERILSWPDRATGDRWSSALLELIRERYPEAFDDEAGA